VITAIFRFESGVYGSGAWCYTTDHDDEYNDIVGSKILDEFREAKRRAP
jgi:hypothetical protein